MSNMRMYPMQNMRRTDQKRGMQRVRQEIIGVYLQVRKGLPDR